MDTLEKQESQRTQASNTLEIDFTTRNTHAMSEHMEDAGNWRQSIHQEWNLHPLIDSLYSEQQKLRVVLDWAHSFLSSTSEVNSESCRADGLKLADTIHRETEPTGPTSKCSFSANYNYPVTCSAVSNEVLKRRGSTEKVCQLEPSNYRSSEQNNLLSGCKSPSQEALHTLFSSGRDDVTWPEYRETENWKSREPQHSTSKQTSSHNNHRTGRQHTSASDISSNQTFSSDAATRLIKAGVSCWSDARKDSAGAVSTSKMYNSDSTDGIHDRARSKRELTGNQKALEEMEVEEERTEDGSMEESIGKSGSAFVVYTNDNVSYSEPQKIREQMAENAKSSCSYHLKIPSNVTVYEQYQLCVDQLQQLRQRQRSEKERKPCEETAAPAEAPVPPTSFFERSSPKTNPEINKCLNKVQNKRLSTADITAERASDTINENRERRRKAEHEDNLNMNETCEDRSLCQRNHGTVHVDLNGKNDSLMKRTAKAIASNDEVISTHTDQMWAAPADVEDGAASAANPGTDYYELE